MSYRPLSICAFLCALIFSTSTFAEPQVIRYPARDASLGEDVRPSYYLTLLEEVLDITQSDFGDYVLQPSEQYLPQGRAVLELKEQHVDVLWTMTSIERERSIWPIRIPLKKGLLGVRVLTVHKNKIAQFDALSSADGIKAMQAIQGHDWPDYQILKMAGFFVTPTSRYKDVFDLLTKSRFDYFPRGILEARAEIEQYKLDDIRVAKDKAIIYRSPIYFFVNKDSKLLHKRIETGLQRLRKSGRFDQLLYQFPAHQSAVELIKQPPELMIHINNPLLPAETPVNDASLWDSTFFSNAQY